MQQGQSENKLTDACTNDITIAETDRLDMTISNELWLKHVFFQQQKILIEVV